MLHVAQEVGFVAFPGPLNDGLSTSGMNPIALELVWFLVQTDDANENANLFFQATFGIPAGVNLSVRELGEQSPGNNSLAAIEAIPSGAMTDEIQQTLKGLGFSPFRKFEYNDSLKRLLAKLAD